MSIPDRRARLLALALAVTAVATVVEAQPALDLEDCRVDGVSVPVRCGSLTVFEDRAAEAGRTIDLKIVVIPAVSGSPEPDPLFLLAGGPGQAATDLAERVLVRLAEVRRSRDIVFVDQRGTGGSGRMSCALFESGSDEGTSGESLQLDTLPLDDLRDCLAEIESAADPRHYTTPVAMDDLDDVRAARLPSNMNADAQRALDRLFADCAAEPGCREAFPDLPETFARVIEELEVNPRVLDTMHPRTGEPFELRLNGSGFAAGLRNSLYSPTVASLLPWTIARAAQGDFGPFLAQIVPLSDSGEVLNPGLFLSVICAEDVSQLADGDAERLAAEGILGRLQVEVITDACSVWPAADLPADYFEPVRSDIPTLLLSGDLDPVTPPRWGEEVLGGLGDARHVVAPGAGHGVIANGCADDVIAEFIEAGSPCGPSTVCSARTRAASPSTGSTRLPTRSVCSGSSASCPTRTASTSASPPASISATWPSCMPSTPPRSGGPSTGWCNSWTCARSSIAAWRASRPANG